MRYLPSIIASIILGLIYPWLLYAIRYSIQVVLYIIGRYF